MRLNLLPVPSPMRFRTKRIFPLTPYPLLRTHCRSDAPTPSFKDLLVGSSKSARMKILNCDEKVLNGNWTEKKLDRGEESRRNRDLFLIKGGWGGSINNEGKQEPLNCVVIIYQFVLSLTLTLE